MRGFSANAREVKETVGQVVSIDRGLADEFSQDWGHILKVRMTGFIYRIREIESEDKNTHRREIRISSSYQ
jgi:hypothetical protein